MRTTSGAEEGAKPVAGQDRTEAFSETLRVALDPTGTEAEAYRTLRTNLFYSFVDDPPRVIVFTSPGPGEGKTTTCANLSVALAQADKSTLVLDCDLRRPALHEVFLLRNFRGVVDVVGGQSNLEGASQEVMPNLKVLTAGPVPPNPAELLGSRRFAELLGRAREEFDYVLIDAPPIEMVSDPLILATQGDGVMLVVNAQKTRKASLRRSMRSLEAVDANVLGTVMNNVDSSKGSYGRYQRYSY